MLRRGLILLPAAVLVGTLLPLRGDDSDAIEKGHDEIAVPFLKRHCFVCHDEKERSGDVVLLPLADRSYRERKGLWKRAARELAAGQMPPDDQPQPDAQEKQAFLAWIKNATATPDEKGVDPGRITVRRLNRAEYSYTVQDLLHVRPRPHDEFPADDAGYGFDRIGDVLTVPPILLERYLQAAEAIANEAILDWKPIKVRQAATELPVIDTHSGDRGSFKVLYSNGRVEGTFKVPYAGEYVMRVRAYGDQAGPEVAKMALLVNGRSVKELEVPGDEKKPETYELKVELEAGDRKLAAAFTNDYYKPDDPDPKQRDRNLAVEWIELEGPAEKPALPWAQATWFDRQPPRDAKPEARRSLAREILLPVASRAWRRPVKPEEIEKLVKLVELAIAENESWERGLQLALEAILCSPSFIFRLELEAKRDGDAEVLDEYALATRLSYFLWSSLPDEELRKEAEAGTLRAHLVTQTKRLIADPRASRLTEQFAVQWLHLRRLDGFFPDPATFPSFDESLRQAARSETEHLFEAILRENRSVKDLIDADFTFVNERLARHYGIEGITGPEMRRIPAPPERRGLTAHASVLMATSNPTRTSPVKRGRWVLEVLLDDPPPPPLPGADSFKDQALTAKTLRERMEQHRAKKECSSCHARMDALGFSLERFDAIGSVRQKDGENPVDDRGALPDGTKLAGAEGLRTWLSTRTPRVARAVARKLLIFATGRGPIVADDEQLDRVVDSCSPDYRLQDLIVAIVQLDAFQKRRVNGGKQWR